MFYEKALRCPICRATVHGEGKSLFCAGPKKHCFDFSAEGYLNLASAKESGGGDDSSLIAARTTFLNSGAYAPFAEKTAAYVKKYADGIVLDAGCGEGYYTCKMAMECEGVIGIDLSKRGIRAGAKRAAREKRNALFAVAGIFALPVADSSISAVCSLFAPIAEEEFLRVLKPGGVLITAGAGPDHLLSMKKVLYEIPRKNEPRADYPKSMEKIDGELLHFDMQLKKEQIGSLFAMTPYYYRTQKEAAEKLLALSEFTCEAEMELAVFRKK